jgi:glutaconyl-CoA/methylmalonyl-CoA decarboxylase subunit gamma
MKKFILTINGDTYNIEIKKAGDAVAEVEVNGNLYNVEINKAIKEIKTPVIVIKPSVPSTDFHPSTAKTHSPDAPKGGNISAPLPGIILDILVKEGDYVKLGQKLLVLEAMKMENNIDSDKEGKVTAVHFKKGDSVMEGDTLIIIGE